MHKWLADTGFPLHRASFSPPRHFCFKFYKGSRFTQRAKLEWTIALFPSERSVLTRDVISSTSRMARILPQGFTDTVPRVPTTHSVCCGVRQRTSRLAASQQQTQRKKNHHEGPQFQAVQTRGHLRALAAPLDPTVWRDMTMASFRMFSTDVLIHMHDWDLSVSV